MPQPRRQASPGRSPSAPPLPSAAAVAGGGLIGGLPGAAAASASLATGAKTQATILQGTVSSIEAILAAIALRRTALIEAEAKRAFPATDISEALAEEARREVVFRKRVADRTRTGMELALKATDPSARAAAIQNVLKREQRFAEMRSVASAERVLASAELQDLRTRSPQGALWQLGPRRTHTEDCVVMSGRFWPWSVLNEVHPLLHVGCGCFLVSLGEAISQGKISAADIPSKSEALRMAAPVIRHVREEAAEAKRKYSSLEESALSELLARRGLTGSANADHLAAAPLAADVLVAPATVLAEADANAEAKQTGAMVALYPDPRRAEKLAVPRGEKPEQLHVTLAFLGTAADLDLEKAKAALAAWAKATPPLTGKLSGIGHFDLGKGGTVTYRSVDLPDLPAPREQLVKDLEKAGVPAKTDHGFTPHMTVAADVRRPPIKQEPIRFSKVTLAWGEERYEFKLQGPSVKQ